MTCRVMGKAIDKDREFFHQASKVDWRQQLLLLDEKIPLTTDKSLSPAAN